MSAVFSILSIADVINSAGRSRNATSSKGCDYTSEHEDDIQRAGVPQGGVLRPVHTATITRTDTPMESSTGGLQVRRSPDFAVEGCSRRMYRASDEGRKWDRRRRSDEGGRSDEERRRSDEKRRSGQGSRSGEERTPGQGSRSGEERTPGQGRRSEEGMRSGQGRRSGEGRSDEETRSAEDKRFGRDSADSDAGDYAAILDEIFGFDVRPSCHGESEDEDRLSKDDIKQTASFEQQRSNATDIVDDIFFEEAPRIERRKTPPRRKSLPAFV